MLTLKRNQPHSLETNKSQNHQILLLIQNSMKTKFKCLSTIIRTTLRSAKPLKDLLHFPKDILLTLPKSLNRNISFKFQTYMKVTIQEITKKSYFKSLWRITKLWLTIESPMIGYLFENKRQMPITLKVFWLE